MEEFFNLFSYSHMDSGSMDYTVDFVYVTLLQNVNGLVVGTVFDDVWLYFAGPHKSHFHFINWKDSDDTGTSVPNESSFLIESEVLLKCNRWGN